MGVFPIIYIVYSQDKHFDLVYSQKFEDLVLLRNRNCFERNWLVAFLISTFIFSFYLLLDFCLHFSQVIRTRCQFISGIASSIRVEFVFVKVFLDLFQEISLKWNTTTNYQDFLIKLLLTTKKINNFSSINPASKHNLKLFQTMKQIILHLLIVWWLIGNKYSILRSIVIQRVYPF